MQTTLDFIAIVTTIVVGIGVLFYVRRQSSRIMQWIRRLRNESDKTYFDLKQVVAAEHASQLLISRFPDVYMPVSSFSMNPVNLMVLLDVVERYRPTLVVELGSGLSSLMIAKTIAAWGGRVITLDQDACWTDCCERQAYKIGLTNLEVRHAPLANRNGATWYASNALDKIREGSVDLLVVDGPYSGSSNGRGREPALRYFRELLSPCATIYMDDTVRAGERGIAEDWAQAMKTHHIVHRKSLSGCSLIEPIGIKLAHAPVLSQ